MQIVDVCMHRLWLQLSFFNFQISFHKAGLQTRQGQETPSTLNDDAPTDSSSSVKSHCK
jgi:hypothetical protein